MIQIKNSRNIDFPSIKDPSRNGEVLSCYEMANHLVCGVGTANNLYARLKNFTQTENVFGTILDTYSMRSNHCYSGLYN